MPDTAERVFIVEDATDRSSSSYTLTVKTVSGTGWNRCQGRSAGNLSRSGKELVSGQ